MKQLIRKPKKPCICKNCGKQFSWTRPKEVHVREIGDKNCYKNINLKKIN